MNRLNTLFSTLGIRPTERKLVGLLLIYAIFTGIPGLLTETAAYSLFLVEFDAEAIPYIYIGFAVVTTLSGIIYTKLESRLSFSKFITLNSMLLILSLCLFRLLLGFSQARWPLVALAIWYESGWALANLGFWSLAVHLLNVQQGKRLFALIGTGLTLAESTIGFFIPGLIDLVGVPNLLLVAAASFFGAMIVQSYILRAFKHQDTTADTPEDTPKQSKRSFFDRFKNRYITLIFALAIFYILTLYILDNLFYERLEVLYPDTNQLAGFIGVFFGATGLLTMAIGILISGRLISRYGVRLGLLITPGVLFISTGLMIGMGTFFESLVILAGLVILTKFFSEILAYTINRAAWQVLYEPLPDGQRLQTQTVVESMIKPIAGGLAGVILLVFNFLVGFGPLQLVYILFAVVAAWLMVVIALNRAYPTRLLQALGVDRAVNQATPAADTLSLTILKQSLTNPHQNVVTYALNKLEEIDPISLPTLLTELLEHPTAAVRLDVLNRVERLKLTSTVPFIRQMAKQDVSALVRGASVRALTSLNGHGQNYDEILGYLEDPDVQVRLGAMVGLLRNGNGATAYTSIMLEKLVTLVNSPDPTEREFAAQVIGEAGINRSNGLLLNLIQDDNLFVKRAALIAAGKLKSLAAWPLVTEALAFPEVRSEATAALIAGGEAILPTVAEAFTVGNQKPDVLRNLPRICAQVGGSQVVALLLDNLSFPDWQVRSQILIALGHCRYKVSNDEEFAVIQQQIQVEIARTAQTLAILIDIGDDESVSLLRDALNNQVYQHYKHIFLLLSFIYDTGSILQVWDAISPNLSKSNVISSQKNAYAIEIIDVLVSLALKKMVIPLLEDVDASERLQRLKSFFPQQHLDRQQRLTQIITDSNARLTSWVRACAIYTVGQSLKVELAEAVALFITAPDRLIRETAVWTMRRLDPDEIYLNISTNGFNAPSIDTEWPESGLDERQAMLLIEKIILLKAVDLFADIPEETLVDIVCNIETLEVQSGQVVIKKGKLNRYLYIIAAGQVQFQDDDQVITTLQRLDIFGELSILGSKPSPYSVIILQDSVLLRLRQETFLKLLDDDKIVSQKFIQHLAQSLYNLEIHRQSDRRQKIISHQYQQIIS